MIDKKQAIMEGSRTGFIDSFFTSNLAYKPQFLSNNHRAGKKVLSSIEDELMHCDKFQISVAFITMGGITPLLLTLKELERKGIPGEILTTNYLTFSEPQALEKLHSLSNITLKMFDVERSGEGFHTKGYIFKKEEVYRIIIGSSNMTRSALTENYEWNMKIVSTENGEMAQEIVKEFHSLWDSPDSLAYDDFIELYKTRYQIIKQQRQMVMQQKIPTIQQATLRPNSMQTEFITRLRKFVNEGKNKSLLLTATGTGKTYAAAFAMRDLGYRKVLFLVHRNQIARQAKQSFENVFGDGVRTGLVSGHFHDYDADMIFATIQTFSKTENLSLYDKDHFEAIIYDEAHHSSANSYKKIFDYFTPKLSLGMTATPDKRDDHIEGRNIYQLFDYNIACEIRLQQAMEEDLLCPFHYFGITDLDMINDGGKAKEEKLEHFRYLTCDERVDHVIEQATYYGYSGDRVKGLIFCSRVDEAKALSKALNARGLKTLALSGEDSEQYREQAIDLLTKDLAYDAYENAYFNAHGVKIYPDEEYLDYLITVDIFSEGTDIVEVNQVIMLRPTQSPIVFIQQLGRGLRKSEGKEYVVILDFIGNYHNNFMIPIALSGDRSYNKDNYRRYLMEGGRVIPGASTVHFDEISKKRIFEAVDRANFSDLKLIKDNYKNLKFKLGRIPSLLDFDEYGEMDVLRIFDNNSLGSYYKFLVKYEKDYKIRLSADEEKVIEFISKKLANGKRIHELEMLRRILHYAGQLEKYRVFADLQQQMSSQYQKSLAQVQKDNLVNIMTNTFAAGSSKATYENCVFIEPEETVILNKGYKESKNSNNSVDTDYRVTETFAQMLKNPDFYHILDELVQFGISRYHRDYSNTYEDTDFVLYQKYTYEDVCRLLNWESNEVPLNIGGYKYDKKTKTFPVFINYDKDENISDTTKYEDHFTSDRTLIAISKSGRSLTSDDVQNFLHAKERGIQVELFVRKNKDDKISKEFYYLGHMEASGRTYEFTMPNTTKTAVEIEWVLDQPVREDLYEYIIS